MREYDNFNKRATSDEDGVEWLNTKQEDLDQGWNGRPMFTQGEVIPPPPADPALVKKRQRMNRRNSALKEMASWLIYIVVALVITLFLKRYIIINANVPSGSMENTIMTGDNLIGTRFSYWDKDPERGDIVIFYYPLDTSQKYIKRVIGLPGDHIKIADGHVYINYSETPLDEPYVKEDWTAWTEANGTIEYDVPEGCYFMMGDNRNDSSDSRYWGYLEKDLIIGKAQFVYFPFKDWGSLY